MTPSVPDPLARAGGHRLPSVSVVLCCHNSAARLPETLRHLALQNIPSELDWEILVIDNGSTDSTASAVLQFAADHPYLRVRLVGEPHLGTGYARQRGITEAAHELVLFVDDDNWLAADYVRVVAETMQQYPEIAALGGASTAVSETPVPAWFPKYQGWYAVTGPSNGQEVLQEESFLWTAGTAFRREILTLVKQLNLPALVSGRRGQSLDAGEDDELCHRIRLSGGRMLRHSGISFQHYLPAARLSWEYLRRLHHAAGLVSVKLDAYRDVAGHSRWPRWLVQCWSIQVAYVWCRIHANPLLLRCARRSLLEGDDRVVQLERYRGRLEGLWAHRKDYHRLVSFRSAMNPEVLTQCKL